jgi:predicted nucleic acid-binding protein
MNAFVLDTNVISEGSKLNANERVISFLGAARSDFMSAVTIHELIFGTEKLADAMRRQRLVRWIAQLRERFSGRIVPMDEDIAELSGRLRAAAVLMKHNVSVADSIVAATAVACNAVVATRNVRDFEPMGVSVINPWDS